MAYNFHAVCFDIGDTLVHFESNQSLYQIIRKYSNLKNDDVIKYIIKNILITYTFNNNLELNYLSKILKCPTIEPLILEIKQRKITPYIYSDVIPILNYIKKSGLLIGTISNTTVWNNISLDSLCLNTYIDYTIYSFNVHYKKPDKDIFILMQKKLNCSPSEILYIGDSYYKDYICTKKIGWNSVLLDRNHKYKSHNIPRNELITSLKELIYLL